MRSSEYAHTIASIRAGTNVVFNRGASGMSPPVEIALLVAVQTNYAGWKGARIFEMRNPR